MLQNVTLLAIVAIHTAANEPPKVRQVMNKIHRNVDVHRRLHAADVLALLEREQAREEVRAEHIRVREPRLGARLRIRMNKMNAELLES